MLPGISIHQCSLEQNLSHSPAPPCREIQYVSFLMILGYQPLPAPPPPPFNLMHVLRWPSRLSHI